MEILFCHLLFQHHSTNNLENLPISSLNIKNYELCPQKKRKRIIFQILFDLINISFLSLNKLFLCFALQLVACKFNMLHLKHIFIFLFHIFKPLKKIKEILFMIGYIIFIVTAINLLYNCLRDRGGSYITVSWNWQIFDVEN